MDGTLLVAEGSPRSNSNSVLYLLRLESRYATMRTEMGTEKKQACQYPTAYGTHRAHEETETSRTRA